MFKINKDQATESNVKVVSTQVPGIYKMQVVGIENGSKFKGKDKPEAPTMDIAFKIVDVIDVPKQDEPKKLIGKIHTDVIDLSLESDKDTKETVFNNKLARVKHILKKAGIAEDAIDAAIEPVLTAMGKKNEWQPAAIVDAIKPLLTEEGKKKTAFGKITGSVYQGTPNAQFSGFLGFYTLEEPKFTAKERQAINEYYLALEGATPSADAPAGGGAAAANSGAF